MSGFMGVKSFYYQHKSISYYDILLMFYILFVRSNLEMDSRLCGQGTFLLKNITFKMIGDQQVYDMNFKQT